MNKILFIIALFFININISISQAHDKVWILGYSSTNKPDYPNNGTTFLTFEKDSIKIESKWIDFDYNLTNTTTSDVNGNMLFTTNVMQVMGNDGKYVKNGDTLMYVKGWFKGGLNVNQGVLVLPIPNDTTRFVLLYSNWIIYNSYPIYTSIFDKKIGHNGSIIEKNKIILPDTVGVGKLTAVKHANGRDWWIRIGSHKSFHYIFLLSPNGLELKSKQFIGNKPREGVGQAVFSPDGRRLVECNSINKTLGMDINIFNFDRCSGLLSNYRQIHFDSSSFIGCAISPNSRFLYFSNGWQVLQYDLEATDIKASQTLVAVWDGFIDFSMTGFELMQLALDGKIYIATNGATHYLHTIEKPNEKGLACSVKQRSVKLFNYNYRSIPNHPNYRLGALKGSPCDTLNKIATNDIKKENIKFFPNPASESLNIVFPEGESYLLLLKDLTGRVLHKENIRNGAATISTEDLPNGLIICELWNENQCIKQEKIVIIH
jgi:hypothetical protein